MSQKLFDAFESFETKQWKQQIQYDLKGEAYNELLWTSSEDITVKPFYNHDDLPPSSTIINKETSWLIGHTIFVQHEAIANSIANKQLDEGVTIIQFTINKSDINWEELLINIPTKTPLLFDLPLQGVCNAWLSLKKMGYTELILANDCISHLVQEGNWNQDTNSDYETWLNNTKEINHFTVDLRPYLNSGAHCVQQLAYGIGQALEYTNRIDSAFTTDIYFKIAVGSNYFFEIAKIRALRILWAEVAALFDLSPHCKIIAEPSRRNKTVFDYNNNLLRSTTECMSAAIGGADIIFNTPYDYHFKKSHEFSSRLSKNQLLILKHESYFDKVSNPADGAYFIENLTYQLAYKALELVKNIEEKGGLVKMLFEGTIQRKIKEQAAKEHKQFSEKSLKLTGVNIYEDKSERMKHQLELYPFLKTNARKTLIEPLMQKRLAEAWEQNRLSHE